jgi:hypothetical protein
VGSRCWDKEECASTTSSTRAGLRIERVREAVAFYNLQNGRLSDEPSFSPLLLCQRDAPATLHVSGCSYRFSRIRQNASFSATHPDTRDVLQIDCLPHHSGSCFV